MRFGLSDLLLATLLVALYATALAVFLRAGDSFEIGTLLFGLVGTLFFSLGPVAGRLGERLVRSPRPIDRKYCATIVFMTSVVPLSLFALLGSNQVAIASSIPLLLGCGLGLLVAEMRLSAIELREGGVVFDGHWLEWSECHVSVAEEANDADDFDLEVTPLHSNKRRRRPMKHRQLAVPAELVSEFRSILAEKQPPAEAATDDTDSTDAL